MLFVIALFPKDWVATLKGVAKDSFLGGESSLKFRKHCCTEMLCEHFTRHASIYSLTEFLLKSTLAVDGLFLPSVGWSLVYIYINETTFALQSSYICARIEQTSVG